MVKFSLFGVPVTIQPWFFLTLVMLGGGLQANGQEALLEVALFVLAGTISVLVHEFGHALVGRRLGGGYATIELVAFMGLARNQGARFTPWQRFWMIAAGPGAGFALLFVVIAILGLAFGDSDALALTTSSLFHIYSDVSAPTAEFLMSRPFLDSLIDDFLWINFWWGVINLIPVIPLDGGQMVNVFVHPQKRVYQIGIVAAAAACLYGLMHHRYYMAAMFAYFGYNNYKAMKEVRWS